jgi:hypothetical protein
MKNYRVQDGCHNCKHKTFASCYAVCGLKCTPPDFGDFNTVNERRRYTAKCRDLLHTFGIEDYGICDHHTKAGPRR